MKTIRTIPYRVGVIGLALCLSSDSLFALPTGSFPFVIPGNEASATITNVSSLNPAPIDNSRRLVVRNGHFYDQTGRRVRLLGTALGTGALFPPKAEDDIIAARLQKYGFNIVRIISFDGGTAPNGIFADSTFTTLDPNQLDLFDSLVAALKRHGIYIHLVLHVNRPFDSANGFPAVSPNLPGVKFVGYFDPTVLALEKQFAHDLLTHVNPYTNLSYANDPDVAIIETTNEDSLARALTSNETSLFPIPNYFLDELVTVWNTWLLNKYKSTAALVSAWFPPLGAEILANGNFSSTNLAPWSFFVNTGTGAAATEVRDTTTPLPSNVTGAACHIHTSKITPNAYDVQLRQTGLTIANNQLYTLQFWAKSSAAATLQVEVAEDQMPFTSYAPLLPSSTALTSTWKLFQFSFNATNLPLANHTRIGLNLGAQTGDIWIAGVTFQSGSLGSTLGTQTLEAKTVALPTVLTPTAEGIDLTSFLIDTESTYATAMRNYVKSTLGSQALVYCTQADFGTFLGALRESSSDLIDNHEYWDSPVFPPSQQINKSNWTITNKAMVGAASAWTMSATGPNRIEGKPYIVSEYNHPAPNDYSAECLPEVASYAALQDWDGLYIFNYAGGMSDYFSNALTAGSWDTMGDHPGKLAYMPMAAKLFLGGTSTPATLGTADVIVPSTDLSQQFVFSPNLNSALQAADPHIVLQNHTGMILDPAATTFSVQQQGTTSASPFHWPASGGNKAIFTTTFDTSESIVGFVGGQTAHAGNLTFTMPTTWNNFTSVALASMDDKPIAQSQSLLLTLMGDVENIGMGWNATRTSIGTQWGTGPVNIEGTPGTVSLQTGATSATVYALDPTGARQQVVPSTLSQGVLTFNTSPTYQTAWYEFAMNGATTTIPSPILENFNGTLTPTQSFTIESAPYNGLAVNFQWNFTTASGTPAASIPTFPTLKAASAISSPAFSLSPQTAGLTSGSYQYSIVAQVGSEFSFPTQGMVTIMTTGLNSQRVYPNPWRSDKDADALITFDQMPNNSTVKIFTISGHLVRTLSAPSGLVTWDLKNDDGHTAASGIYLYLVTDNQNNKTRGKLAIIR